MKAAEAKAANQTVEIVIYRKDVADDGWKRMLAWFKKYGVA